ncbi:O-antigen polymerase [Anabaenopsis circularis NIES-21]|uniref:O-antigen polymerase n=1 Tax=Anabaenopsis circularis NIES-21 TaxID=1085406 RepID=A0A1Z4GIX1_9CYAN|nr:O-antigen polymerase [Anabaenopsis circularis NIES-21]
MKKLLIGAEYLFTVVALLIYSGAILDLILSGGAQENEFVEFDSTLIRVINLLLYIATSFLLVLRWKKSLYFLIKGKWIFALIILAAISIIWSFEPATTLKDSFTLIGSTLFGIYLASRYTLKQQLYLLTWAFGIAILLSFIFAIALPKYGIMGGIHQGKWRGVFLHKNGLGAAMLNSGIVFLIMAYQNRKQAYIFWLGFSLSFLLLLLASSTSSLVNLLILISAFFIFQTFRWSYNLMIPTIMLIVTLGEGAYFWFNSSADILFSSIGKDATLTGRTDLWPLVLEMIWKHPWLGYGYGGFWQGWNGESASIWWAAGWTPTHPHNGYLALWLDLGILGLGIFFIGFLQSYLQALAWVRNSKTSVEIWPIIHMTYIVIVNLTESSLVKSNSISWILYVAVCLSLFLPANLDKKISTQ